MNRGSLFKYACGTAVAMTLAALPAHAAPKDKKSNKAIGKAIEEFYLATKFDKAEDALFKVIQDCADECSAGTVARAWMYIGIVRGGGTRDYDGALEAFELAYEIDKTVELDDVLASDEVKEAFSQVTGKAPEPEEQAPVEVEQFDSTKMLCVAVPSEIELRRPIPIQCIPSEGGKKIQIGYKAPGRGWVKTFMKETDPVARVWQGTISCEATREAGELEWYAQTLDQDGNVVTEFGNDKEPKVSKLVKSTDEPPPTFPGEDPPAKCQRDRQQPKESQVAWGESCDSDDQCESDLVCNVGMCDHPASCDGDSECDGGYCDFGTCRKFGEGGMRPQYNWVGIQASLDVMQISGENICDPASDGSENFDCALNGSLYEADPPTGSNRGGNFASGFLPATLHAMLTYERILPIPGITLGAELRGGLILFGTTGGDVGFSTTHVELRGKYYFGATPLTETFRAFVSVGAGLGGATADIEVETEDCGWILEDDSLPPQDLTPYYNECKGSFLGVDARPGSENPTANVEQDLPTASGRAGDKFVSLGLGGVYAVTPHIGLVFSLEGAMLFPRSGISIRPTLGAAYGF